jgi:uroporphyrinogen-III synthase
VVVASVGPVMTSALEALGISPQIIPKHPKMASLVKAAAEQSNDARLQKRARRNVI